MNLTTPRELPPIEGLEFFDAIHRYSWKGQLLPYSVSAMAKQITPDVQRKFDETQHIWGPRGVGVHHAAYLWKTTGKPGDLGNYGEWIEPLMAHPHVKLLEPIAAEYRLADLRHGIGGTFDLLGRLPGEPSRVILVDYKTLGTHGRDYDIRAQLGGYLSLLWQHWPMIDVDSCWGVWIKPGKTYTTTHDPIDCLAEWEARRSLYLKPRLAPA